MSDIRVSVQWKSSAVFAGEEVECIVTFKNVGHEPQRRKSPSPNSQIHGQGSGRDRWKDSLPQYSNRNSIGHTRNSSISKSGQSQQTVKGNGSPLSLASPFGTRQNSSTNLQQGSSTTPAAKQEKHRRSISIVSLGNDMTTSGQKQHGAGGPAYKQNTPGHARAASLHVLPRQNSVTHSGPTSAPADARAVTLPSPLLRESTFTKTRSTSPNTSISSPRLGTLPGSQTPRWSRPPSNSTSSKYKLPNVPSLVEESGSKNDHEASSRPVSSRPYDVVSGSEQVNHVTRVLSDLSVNGTPRSSGEFFSLSNDSSDTLASSYVGHDQARMPLRPVHSRQTSSLNPNKLPTHPEVLMMGYGHIVGSFTLDSSLINQTPFEEVKRKMIIGDQGGGGVVRSESVKRNSNGLFGFSAWGNIGDTFGGLLGGGELSSIKEKKVRQSIPILSTPQSIFFVDLHLRAGESKTFTYSHRLPMGIPPTHKGRALKVTYSLVVGSQRAVRNSHKHNVQHVDIPFRVLPTVNAQGDTLGHDLMSPHIILRDEARTNTVVSMHSGRSFEPDPFPPPKQDSSSQDFLSYVGNMLDRQRQTAGSGLLSPSENINKSLTPTIEEPRSVKESIELAILRSNFATSNKRGVTRFEITRGADRIAVILLPRPSYRLGEAVPVVVAFDEAHIPCYSLHVTLESSETVDPAIALRSKASILRVTRRIHASHQESTIFARRSVFSPVIPMSSTPEFLTSGVSLEWRLRFEFVTSRSKDPEYFDAGTDDLLEELSNDDRGTVAAGLQALSCEILDVTVPLHVYGAIAVTDEMHIDGDFPI